MPQPLKTFISYSHKDENLKDALMGHMVNLMLEGLYLVWEDRKISPGTKWEAELTKKLKESNVILLLVSAHFLASDYCRSKELRIALERAASNNTRVVPVILSDCEWDVESVGLNAYQALPRDGKAIDNPNNWGSASEAFKRVIKELRDLAEDVNKSPEIRSFTELDFASLPSPNNRQEIFEIDKYSCDRKEQQIAFTEHLLDHEDSNFYFSFVCGNREEQVDSFIKRIYLEVLSEEADDAIQSINVAEKSAVTFTFLRKLEHTIKMFRKNLIRDIHLQADESISSDCTFRDIAALSAFSSLNALVINLKVYSEDWIKTDHGEGLVRWLFEDFFRSSIKEGCAFKVTVFFSIIFNHEIGASGDKKKETIKKQISRGVAEIRKSDLSNYVDSSYCEISELPQVPHKDLEDWFSLFYSNTLDVKEIMSRMFEEQKPFRSMAEIEQKTHPMIDEFLNRTNGI